jgi:cyclic di-GMP phosphodiesterase
VSQESSVDRASGEAEDCRIGRLNVGDVISHAGRILVVDDVPANIALLKSLLVRAGHDVLVASNGEDALQLITRECPDLVLMDVLMPRMNGFEVCQEVKRQPATRLIPVVLITALNDVEDRIKGIKAGADEFLSKPFNVHELKARVDSLLKLKRYTDELDSAESVIISLAMTIEARDAYTDGHCHRLANYAAALGLHLGLAEEDVSALHRGGYLHDIGKVGVPDGILQKPARLTPEEFERMKLHTTIGDRLLGGLRSLRDTRPIVRHHHERIDGSGYPDGLRDSQIPLLAQIMGVVDVYDALTTVRPYKPAYPPEEAYHELREEAQRGWRDRGLVEEFLGLCRSGRLTSLIEQTEAMFKSPFRP